MNILVLGGTRFVGVHLVKNLLENNNTVTVATRGITKLPSHTNHLVVNRMDYNSMKSIFKDKIYDVVYDSLAYCSNDVKIALDNIKYKRYIMTSSMAVYNLHQNTVESDFQPQDKKLIWCNREDLPYNKAKQSAECAVVQIYSKQEAVLVRFPFIIGKDDYTKRLYSYVSNIVNEIPMNIDNLNSQMSFITSNEAGRFLSFLSASNITGAINGACSGAISLKEIIDYLEKKLNKKAIISKDGEIGAYNGTDSYSANTDKAMSIGFKFENLHNLIYDLLDYYIYKVKSI